MRTAAAFAVGIALGASCGAVATYVAMDAPHGRGPVASTLQGRVAAPDAPSREGVDGPPSAAGSDIPTARSGAVPVTPRYRDRDRPAPDASAAVLPRAAPPSPVPRQEVARAAPTDGREQIYRCRSSSGTVYSNVPCEGGRVVDQGAASGYDSRPSERLEGLVAGGRSADAGSATTNVRSLPAPAPVNQSGACTNMRQQIVDIDAATLRPLPVRELDRLRAIRQDIRTSMARDRC